jgi:hypothetical protein
LDRVAQGGFHQTGHRRALSTRQDERIDVREIGREPNWNAFNLAGTQSGQVFPKIPLQREDADAAWTSQTLVWH